MKSEQMRPEAVGTLGKTPDAQPTQQDETKVKLRFVFEQHFTVFGSQKRFAIKCPTPGIPRDFFMGAQPIVK